MTITGVWRRRVVHRMASTSSCLSPRKDSDGVVHGFVEIGYDFDTNEPHYISLCGRVSTSVRSDETADVDCMACIAESAKC